MKKIFLLSALVLTCAVTKAAIKVTISDDSSKNGIHRECASVDNTAGRTECDFVQLWADGPKWATFNVGATITDYANLTAGTDATSGSVAYYNTANVGGLYSWIRPDRNARVQGWTSDLDQWLVLNVANDLWGHQWTVPSKADFVDMINNTHYTWCDGTTTQYVPGCTLAGYKVYGKGDFADKSIFLPAAGIHTDGTISNVGTIAHYWSNTAPEGNAICNYFLRVRDGYLTAGTETDSWQLGNSVRAILWFPHNTRTLTLKADNCPDATTTITCPPNDWIQVTAEATRAGYQFVRWSDGNTDNPRTIQLDKDSTLTAIYDNKLTLVDGTVYTTVSDPKDLTYQRTVYDNDWNLLYVPFSMDIADLATNHNIQIYALNMFHQYDDDNNGTFERMTMEVLKLQSGKTIANHPYLFKYTGTLTADEQQNGKTLNIHLGTTTLATAKAYSNLLKSMSFQYNILGTYSAINSATAANAYTLVWNSSLGACTFGHPTSGILPQRWYFTLKALDSQSSDPAGAPIRIVVAGEENSETTDLSNVSDESSVSKKIINGRMVIVRGGVTYDLNGRIVK